jgi:peptidoglycan/LPS O-acetylase OafA/YrhL
MNRAEPRLPVIDGVRAIAVIAVVLFHGFPARVSGGFIGVDIFFVISGFVIAMRYLEPMIAREVGFGTFFLRRIRRLVPPYFAMLVAVTAAAAWIMVPKDLINFGASLAGQALYAQNIVFWLQGDYFDAALGKPLLHTWSLAVEEQFYLCFPLLVLGLRQHPRLALAACVLLSLVVFGVAAYLEQISPKTAFYWLPFRTWEFLAGIAAAALFRRGFPADLPQLAASAIGVVALLGIVVAILAFDGDTTSVLTQGLLAVGSTFALCLMQERLAPAIRALFTNRTAQHFGRISYSWYLWHWPPLVIAFLLISQPATGTLAVVLTLLGYGLGLLSWWILERGLARTAWLATPSRAVALLVAFLAFCGGIGGALIASNGFLQRYPERERPLLLAQMDRPSGRCDLVTRLTHWRGQTCPVNTISGPGGILFIGDSHLEMQKEALAAMGDRYGVPVFITKQNCRLIDFEVDRNCKRSVWRGIVNDMQREHITRVVAVAYRPDQLGTAAYDKAVARLLTTGARVVLERPTPADPRLAPVSYLGRAEAWGEASLYPRQLEEKRQRPIGAAIDAWLIRDPRVTATDPVPVLCPGDRCLFAHDGVPLYSDTHHLTKAGAFLVAPIYAPLFREAARDRQDALKVPR